MPYIPNRIPSPLPTLPLTERARLMLEIDVRGLWAAYDATLARCFGSKPYLDYTREQQTWAALLVIGRDILL